MKDFLQRNKIILIISVITVLIIGGGILPVGKSSSPTTNGKSVSTEILVPGDALITSGIVDSKYLPKSDIATVTLVEFGDYVCPACGEYAPYVKKILSDFPGKVNYVFRNYPLSYHSNAPLASYAALAAGYQGKYWEMHDKLYSTQTVWQDSTDPKSTFLSYANELGLNIEQFLNDMNSQKVSDTVNRDKKDGDKVGLRATPTFFLNGTELSIAKFEDLEQNVAAAFK